MQRGGFSLVELSIVLVILGLLVGGILAGQSLIRASELRAVMTEYNRYATATKAFRDKYFAIPGDMTNATSLWGVSTSCSGTSATGTCNGNGDGQITPGSANSTGEAYQFWNQLALAGLIQGTYTGTAGATSGTDATAGVDIPFSKIPGGAWYAWYWGTIGDSGANSYQGVNYGNGLHIGGTAPSHWPSNPLFKPEEAWNIDTKMDDGKPASGRVIARFWADLCASADSGGSSNTNLVASYRLSDSNIRCTLYFTQAY